MLDSPTITDVRDMLRYVDLYIEAVNALWAAQNPEDAAAMCIDVPDEDEALEDLSDVGQGLRRCAYRVERRLKRLEASNDRPTIVSIRNKRTLGQHWSRHGGWATVATFADGRRLVLDWVLAQFRSGSSSAELSVLHAVTPEHIKEALREALREEERRRG